MGPFFALGRLAALQPWVVQRLWIGARADRRVPRHGAAGRAAGHRHAVDADRRGPRLRPVAHRAHPARRVVREFLPLAMLPWILRSRCVRGSTRSDDGARPPPGRARPPGRPPRSRCAAASTPRATVAVLVPALIYLLTLAGAGAEWRHPRLVGARPSLLATCWWSSRCAAVEVRRLDRAVHRERGRHHVGDQPVQHPAGHRELGQLPGGERAALVAAGATGSPRGRCRRC